MKYVEIYPESKEGIVLPNVRLTFEDRSELDKARRLMKVVNGSSNVIVYELDRRLAKEELEEADMSLDMEPARQVRRTIGQAALGQLETYTVQENGEKPLSDLMIETARELDAQTEPVFLEPQYQAESDQQFRHAA